MYTGRHAKTRYSFQILMNLDLSRQIFRSFSSNFMKICPEGADLFHADGETELTELVVAYRNFAKEPKIEL